MKVLFPTSSRYNRYQEEVKNASDALFLKTGTWADKWTGWLEHPYLYPETKEYEEIKEAAEYVRNNFDIVLSCGIGGSYLGARAVIEAVFGDYNTSPRRTGPEIYFVGNSTSSEVIEDILVRCKDKKVCIINISKSGKTLETALAFRTFCAVLNPYVITITGTSGVLRNMTKANNWVSFVVPEDIGGRYSVFTAVGLLTIAIAGIDIDMLLEGARKAMTVEGFEIAQKYAVYRYANSKYGFELEFFAVSSPYFTQLLEWHKQLFAESHGKDGKGTFPTGGTYPMDLHSVGQFIQEGTELFFETQLIRQNPKPLKIQSMPDFFKDGLEKYSGLNFDQVNKAQMDGTKEAHQKRGMDVAQFIIEPDVSLEEELGFFMQIDMTACPIEAYMLGVNPFDQPGVEEHKNRTAEKLEEIINSK